MIIISKYKDCYDFLSTIYGVDKKVIYNRKECKITNEQFSKMKPYVEKLIGHWDSEYRIPTSNINLFEKEFYYQWICVNSKMFLCLSKIIIPTYTNKGFTITTREQFQVITKEDFNYINQYERKNYGLKNFKYEKYIGDIVNSNIVEISKIINQPIFNLSELAKYCYNPKLKCEKEYYDIIPNLDKLHISSVYSVEQIYQDLNYFLVNVLKDSPDVTPPIEISDKDKIEGHGFDKKISFRKRK